MTTTDLHILLCEDDEVLGTLLRDYLIAKGYHTTLFSDGEAGLHAFQDGGFDMCLLDVMMPKMDGFTLAKAIRNANSEMPIIFLTAKNLKEDIAEGFESGADDYLTKPFSMDELVYRIEAILRRVRSKQVKKIIRYHLGRYTFDTLLQTLSIDGTETALTTKESHLLQMLCNAGNEVLQRDVALKTIWGVDNFFNARSMDVYIAKLRKHLNQDPDVKIHNVHGKGYRLAVSNLWGEE